MSTAEREPTPGATAPPRRGTAPSTTPLLAGPDVPRRWGANSLLVRLVLSHLLVAVAGAGTTFVLVRALAPQLFDEGMRMATHGQGQGMGFGRVLREQFATAVTSALGVGVGVGLLVGGACGAFAAYRLSRPLAQLGAATRRMATGHYDVDPPRPGTRELDALADDVHTLGQALAQTETRRVRLLGEVAHELRTPLTVIDGYVEAMIDGIMPADPPTLARLGAESRRLRRLADDLSALSRAQEGRLDIDPRPCDLRELVAGCVGRLLPQAQDVGVELTVSPAGEAVSVRADPDRIAQVVTNLLGNALRATPPGGRVGAEVGVRDGQAVVRVVDTGEGLAPDDVERVFERFYRVPGRRTGSTGAADSGSGIGLTIARGLALAHGGTLTAASPGRGRGATFTLTLPPARGV